MGRQIRVSGAMKRIKKYKNQIVMIIVFFFGCYGRLIGADLPLISLNGYQNVTNEGAMALR